MNDISYRNYFIFPMNYINTSNFIIKTVASNFDISVRDIKSTSKKRNILNARMIFAIIMFYKSKTSHNDSYLSLGDIAKLINRDHALILYYIKQFISYLKSDSILLNKFKIVCDCINLNSTLVIDFIENYNKHLKS